MFIQWACIEKSSPLRTCYCDVTRIRIISRETLAIIVILLHSEDPVGIIPNDVSFYCT